MNEMIERVAKRLWDDSFDRMPDPPWEETTELQKRFNRMLARSAIHAMGEWSEAQIDAAARAIHNEFWRRTYGDETGTAARTADETWTPTIIELRRAEACAALKAAALTGHETGGRNG